MINFICETVEEYCITAFNSKVEFLRDGERSALFAPVFQIVINDKPVPLLFNTAVINKTEGTFSARVNKIIAALLHQISNNISNDTNI